MDVALNGSPITYEPDDDQLDSVNLDFAAFDGQVGGGFITIPNPDDDSGLDANIGSAVQVNEIATRLTDAFIIDQDSARGPLPAFTAREYQYGIADANAILGGFRVINTRPAETDYARVIAMVALYQGIGTFPTVDTTWVLNTNTVTMPLRLYRGDAGFNGELIPDLTELTGKTMFVHDKAGGGRCLHYHLLTEGHTSGLTINDGVDDGPGVIDSITVFAPGNPTRKTTGIDLFNDIYGNDQNGLQSYASDSGSKASYDAAGLHHEAYVVFDAVDQADLDAKTAAHLASYKDPYVTYTCTIGPLDATALSRIRVGDLIPVTSQVMVLVGGISPDQRIAHMSLKPTPGAPGLWNADLELGGPVRRRGRGRGAKGGPFDPGPGGQPPSGGLGTPVPVEPCSSLADVFADQDPMAVSSAGAWTLFTNGAPINDTVVAAGGAVAFHQDDYASPTTAAQLLNTVARLTLTTPLVQPWRITSTWSLPMLDMNPYVAQVAGFMAVVSPRSGFSYDSTTPDMTGTPPLATGLRTALGVGGSLGQNGSGGATTATIVLECGLDGIQYSTITLDGASLGRLATGTATGVSYIDFGAQLTGNTGLLMTGLLLESSPPGCAAPTAYWGQYYGRVRVGTGTGSDQTITLPFPFVAGTLTAFDGPVGGAAPSIDTSNEDGPAGTFDVLGADTPLADAIWATWRLPLGP